MYKLNYKLLIISEDVKVNYCFNAFFVIVNYGIVHDIVNLVEKEDIVQNLTQIFILMINLHHVLVQF